MGTCCSSACRAPALALERCLPASAASAAAWAAVSCGSIALRVPLSLAASSVLAVLSSCSVPPHFPGVTTLLLIVCAQNPLFPQQASMSSTLGLAVIACKLPDVC